MNFMLIIILSVVFMPSYSLPPKYKNRSGMELYRVVNISDKDMKAYINGIDSEYVKNEANEGLSYITKGSSSDSSFMNVANIFFSNILKARSEADLKEFHRSIIKEWAPLACGLSDLEDEFVTVLFTGKERRELNITGISSEYEDGIRLPALVWKKMKERGQFDSEDLFTAIKKLYPEICESLVTAHYIESDGSDESDSSVRHGRERVARRAPSAVAAPPSRSEARDHSGPAVAQADSSIVPADMGARQRAINALEEKRSHRPKKKKFHAKGSVADKIAAFNRKK